MMLESFMFGFEYVLGPFTCGGIRHDGTVFVKLPSSLFQDESVVQRLPQAKEQSLSLDELGLCPAWEKSMQSSQSWKQQASCIFTNGDPAIWVDLMHLSPMVSGGIESSNLLRSFQIQSQTLTLWFIFHSHLVLQDPLRVAASLIQRTALLLYRR